MEARNFHTSLVGGFRKRDVISYLAEEKRLQEQQLEELRAQARELEEQLDQARTDGGANRLLNEDLQNEVTGLRQQLDLLRAELAAAREAQALAEHLLTRAEAEKKEAEGRLDRVESALAETEQLLNEAQQQDLSARISLEEKIDELQARLEQAEVPLDLSAYADGIAQMEELQQALEQERARSARLEELLAAKALETAAKPAYRPEGENSDQLWALCGKMERTIRQMEQMLDGPYRMTCYPEHPVREPAAEAPAKAEPVREEPVRQPEAKPSVSTLLQRVRGK